MTSAQFPDLAGKSVFITGGGSGIGSSLTDGFLAQGAKVCFVGRSDYSDFVKEMGEKHGNAPLFIRCDVTEIEALKSAMKTAAATHGPIDILVNNAANDIRVDALEVSESDWDEMLAVNLKHYFFACQQAALQMAKGGSIINFSSITYLMGAGGLTPYVASNAGIVGMTRALAREWGGKGIRVNALAPGWVLTEKQLDKWATDEGLKAHLDTQCLKTHIQPDDIIGPTLFLASDASAMVTSQCLVVDAGVEVTG